MKRMTRAMRGAAGLTLIELMVVVAIIAILAAIGYPMYSDQVRKARRTDARSALQQIALAQERYFTTHGSYTATLSNLDLPSTLTDGDTEEGYYNLSVVVSGAGSDTFQLTATPVANKSQADDGDCTSLTLDQAGSKGATGADTDGCW